MKLDVYETFCINYKSKYFTIDLYNTDCKVYYPNIMLIILATVSIQ